MPRERTAFTDGEPLEADRPDGDPVAALKDGIRQFAADRGWDPYHTPKNLTMALASEVGELCDVFRWLTPEESVAASAGFEKASRTVSYRGRRRRIAALTGKRIPGGVKPWRYRA